jgi:predicted RNA-binding Zn ribbon-like protein
MDGQNQPFLFVGNHPALDFINTQMIVKGKLTDLIERFEDLVSWLVQAKLLTKSQSEGLGAKLDSRGMNSLLEQAKRLRTTVRFIAERIATRKPIPDQPIQAINQCLSQHPSYPQLVRTKKGFERHFHSAAIATETLLAPLAEAASDMLCLLNFALIKKCANAVCILYFYDTTKNHRRNWCSMQLCGNRMKVAAYFERKRNQRRR